MRFWPIIGFLIAQTGGALWWAATTNAEMAHLKRESDKVERAISDIPDMKASLRNIEKILERALTKPGTFQ